YFIAKFAEPEDRLSWTSFSREHVDLLVSGLLDEENKSWNWKALKFLSEARPDLADIVRTHASAESGIPKAALLYCVSPADPAPIFEALAKLSEVGIEGRERQCAHLL